MDIIIELTFFSPLNLKNDIVHILEPYDVSLSMKKFEKTQRISWNVFVKGSPISTLVEAICDKLYKEKNITVGEGVRFIFNDNDFERSPLFHLRSTGNSGKAFMGDKGKATEWVEVCSVCGLKAKKQLSPLVLNTAKTGGRFMLNVDTDYWIASEEMLKLMQDWKITGYKLEEVIHKGSAEGKQTYYQIIPRHTLPPWSLEMKHYHFVTHKEARCSACDIRGRIDYPYHYDENALSGKYMDINMMKEWVATANWGWAYHPVFISRRFRELLIEYKITRDVRDQLGL